MSRRGGAPTAGGSGWSIGSSSSNTTGAAGSGGGGKALPIIQCPQCHIPVMKLRSGTERNPGRWFYKCPKHHKVRSQCPERFYKWEEDYELYLLGHEMDREERENDGVAVMELENAKMMELLCAMKLKNEEMLSVINSNSRQIGNIVLVGATCAFFMLLICALLVAVMIKM